MSTLVKDFGSYSLWNVSNKSRTDVTDFVLNVYRDVYDWNPPDFAEQQEAMRREDKEHEEAYFYAVKDEQKKNILGTIMVSGWKSGHTLPLQQEFDIDINHTLKRYPFQINNVWYLGRFAVNGKLISNDPQLLAKRVNILKLLLQAGFRHVASHQNNVVFAECDSRLHQKLKLMGANFDPIDKGKMVMGSVALPIVNTGVGLRPFCEQHKHILDYHV